MQMYTNSPIVEGLTFDDVLLIPAHSDEISLHTPIVSAAMDTVTEADLAIAIAREGGIGVIHKNMPIEVQMEQVRKVKRAENGMIYDPVTIRENATVGDALNLMHENHIGGIPVVDARGMLCGIVTNRDLRFQDNPKTPVSEVMTKENLITTTDGTNLKEATELLRRYKIEKLLVVDKDGRLAGLITYKDIMKIKDNPTASKDAKGRLLVAAAVGIKVRQKFPDLQIIAGNIATGEAAKALKECGVDAVKVGIGPGSICTTRIIAGVGVPQLSAVMMAAEALKGSGIPIIADGGIRYSGDIVKALAAGADTIMAGSLFAGVEESPGETIILNGRKFKSYRGMGSLEAMQLGSKDRYFQDMEEDIKKLVPEGIVAQVPYKGTLSEVVYQLIGGLRAGMGYCGAHNLAELKNARFVRITAAGMAESHPHDVTITREAPNYSR